jgi:hypothetical protein
MADPEHPAADDQHASRTCSKCGEAPAGPGGILCGPCRTAIEENPPWPVGDRSSNARPGPPGAL